MTMTLLFVAGVCFVQGAVYSYIKSAAQDKSIGLRKVYQYTAAERWERVWRFFDGMTSASALALLVFLVMLPFSLLVDVLKAFT